MKPPRHSIKTMSRRFHFVSLEK